MTTEEQEYNYKKMKQKYLKEQLKMNNWNPDDFALHLANRRDNGKLIRY